jgi:hypothetical protein
MIDLSGFEMKLDGSAAKVRSCPANLVNRPHIAKI